MEEGLALSGKSFHREVTDQTNEGEVIWYKVTSGKHKLPLRSPSIIHLSPNTLTHTLTHTHTSEAVVLFDYQKQQDDELSLKVGDVITDVKQVCAQYLLPYMDHHISYMCSFLKCYPANELLYPAHTVESG